MNQEINAKREQLIRDLESGLVKHKVIGWSVNSLGNISFTMIVKAPGISSGLTWSAPTADQVVHSMTTYPATTVRTMEDVLTKIARGEIDLSGLQTYVKKIDHGCGGCHECVLSYCAERGYINDAN